MQAVESGACPALRRYRRRAVATVVACAVSVLVAAPARSQAPPPDGLDAERSEILHSIDRAVSMGTRSSDDAAYIARVRAETDRLAATIERIERFLEQHPGDLIRDRLELAKLRLVFLLTTLRGQTFDRLRSETVRITAAAPVGELKAAAAYWRLQINMGRSPASWAAHAEHATTLRAAGDNLSAELAAHSERYRSAVTSVRIVERLARDAMTRRDFPAVEHWLGILEAHHPRHVATAALAGSARLHRAMGEPWRPEFETIDGRRLAWDELRGAVVAIVFWAPRHRPALELLRALRDRQAELGSGTLGVVAVALHSDPAGVRQAIADLGVKWPCVCDGRGWDSPLAHAFGIRGLPTVLLLDRSGVLAAVLTPDTLNIDTRLQDAVDDLLHPAGAVGPSP